MKELKDLDLYIDFEELQSLEELKDYRKKLGVTLKEVASELLMKPSYYSAIESGRRKSYAGDDLMEFIEDVQDAIHKQLKMRKENSYNLEMNLSEDNEKAALIWQIITPQLFNQAIIKLTKGVPFYKVCFMLEIDELELESKLKSRGYENLLATKTTQY